MKKIDFLNILQYTGAKRFQKLLYEFFYWDIKKIDKNLDYLKYTEFEDIESLVENLEQYVMNWNLLTFQILITDLPTFINDHQILNNINNGFI